MDAFTLCQSGSKTWSAGPFTDRPYKLFFRLEKRDDTFDANICAEFCNLNPKEALDAALGFDAYDAKELRNELRELKPDVHEKRRTIYEGTCPSVNFDLPFRDIEVWKEYCGCEGGILSVLCFFRNPGLPEGTAQALARNWQQGKLDPAEWLDIL